MGWAGAPAGAPSLQEEATNSTWMPTRSGSSFLKGQESVISQTDGSSCLLTPGSPAPRPPPQAMPVATFWRKPSVSRPLREAGMVGRGQWGVGSELCICLRARETRRACSPRGPCWTRAACGCSRGAPKSSQRARASPAIGQCQSAHATGGPLFSASCSKSGRCADYESRDGRHCISGVPCTSPPHLPNGTFPFQP